MKVFHPAFSILVLMLALTACDSVDKELVSKIQNDIKEFEGLSGALETLGTGVTNLATQVNAAPEAMKAENNPALNELLTMSNDLVHKHESTLAEYKDLMNKLKSLAADYSSGKLKTEQVRKEFETLKSGIEGVSDLVGRMTAMTNQMQTEFAKMTADWNAKAEGGVTE